MSIKLNKNNWIIISNDDPLYEDMKDFLTIVEKELVVNYEYDRILKRKKQTYRSVSVNKYLYDIKNNELLIPYGLLCFIKHMFKNREVIDYTNINHPL